MDVHQQLAVAVVGIGTPFDQQTPPLPQHDLAAATSTSAWLFGGSGESVACHFDHLHPVSAGGVRERDVDDNGSAAAVAAVVAGAVPPGLTQPPPLALPSSSACFMGFLSAQPELNCANHAGASSYFPEATPPCFDVYKSALGVGIRSSLVGKEDSVPQKENKPGLTVLDDAPPCTSAGASLFPSCHRCSEAILDKWKFVVNGTFWHPGCLACGACGGALEETPTCFWRENRVFCRQCYQTQFAEAKCASCQRSIAAKDWVRRAREFVYHLACFACSHCQRQLSTGEEFSLTNNRLLCKQHYLELIHGHCKTKTKRVRTTFAEEQLSVLQAHFQIDSNPDGADLEKIANITGLSKRVTQVWFQNSRARQKKYQGSKKARTAATAVSGRSSTTTGSAPGSPGCDGMLFPTSVTTSTEDASDKGADSGFTE